MHYLFIHLLFLLNISNFCSCVEPFIAIGGIVTAGIASFSYLNCKLSECCQDPWVNFDVAGLKADLHDKVFGQHLVQCIVPRVLNAHMQKESPPKALVMSFHGWTGSGKNLVSYLVAKNIFQKRDKSQYYHLYLGAQFADESNIKHYKEKLKEDIERATKRCERNLFIFDEMDKMAPGVLDVLSPYVDYHASIGGTNYRKNIFIFLSNAGGTKITEVAMTFWANGKERESIKLKDVEPVITRGAFNEVGGLYHSTIVKKDLIDVYVPFLPLERKHVKLCIQEELRSRGKKSTTELVNNIADQLIYRPEEEAVFSVSGCKKVAGKVDIFVD